MPARSFQDLIVWQKAHQLALLIYKHTGTFPKSEMYGLTNQIRRAAVSIPSNIAEGFGRRGSKEKQQFLYIASGSLLEIHSQLLIARDLGYINQSICNSIQSEIDQVGRLLNSYITKLKNNIK